MSRYRLPGPFIALLGLFALTAAPAPAQTPPDTLVMAKDIGDIITFDPGESFELTAGEILANVYDRIMTFEPEDPGTLTGGVAESHTVSDDGRTITLRIRDGLTFHSGNPVRPEDVEFSLERVVRRGGSPAFILTQLGWNADNVGERRRAGGGGRRASRPHQHRRGILARAGATRALGRHRIGSGPGAGDGP